MQAKIVRKVLSVILSVSLMLQMGMPVAYAKESNPIQETKTITAFGDLAEDVKNLTAPIGTLEEELPLPQTVTAAIYEETTEDVVLDVTWESNKPFPAEVEDTFTYTAKISDEDSGNYTLAERVTNAEDKAKIEDAVSKEVTAENAGKTTAEFLSSEGYQNIAVGTAYTYPQFSSGTVIKSSDIYTNANLTLVRISFKDYAPGKIWDGTAIANPTEGQLTLENTSYENVVFTWYRDSVGESNKLSSAPSTVGTYYVVASVAATETTSVASTTSTAIIISEPETVIELSDSSFPYNGKAQEPAITVRDSRTAIDIDPSEYTVSYSNNTNAGTATITITDGVGGNYTINGTKTFTITKVTPNVTVFATPENGTFLGEPVKLFVALSSAANEILPGTLTIKDGKTTIASNIAITAYGVFYTWTNAGIGNHSITAVYTPTADGKGANYNGVTSTAYSYSITKQNQSALTISNIGKKTYGDADFTLEATGGSGKGEVTYSVPENNGVLSINGSTATIIGAGEVTVTATKAEDDNYNSTTTTRTITIDKADTNIAFNSSYATSYTYTGTALSVPGDSDLTITGASYSDVTFTWYDITSGTAIKLTTAPSAPGQYMVVASIAETANTNSTNATRNVSISFYSGAVTIVYNDSSTKADWYTSDVTITATGYTISDSMDGAYTASHLLSGEGAVGKTLYFKQDGTGYITDGQDVTANIDKTLPAFSGGADGISISDNNWKQFLNQITFGHFFTDTKNVGISATDSGSGVDEYYYYIDTSGSTTAKTTEELDTLSFTESASFSISDENKYVIYAYAVDLAGNRSAYICTDGIVIDRTAPTVTLTAPAGSDLEDVSAIAKVQMNETGTIAYVIKTSEQSGITAQNILDATDKNMISVTDGKTDTNLDVALSSLTANTTYYIYAVGTDSAENNCSVVSASFTTTTTQPVFAGSPTITGIYGQQVKDMMISQVPSTNGIAGSWSVSSTDKPSVGTSATYDVVFTPEDVAHYATVTVSVIPTIGPKSLTAAGVTIEEVSGTYTYDGTAQEPTITVTDSAAIMTASDYEYSYSNNTNAGTATVTVTAKGNFTGTANRTFTIAKAPAPSIIYPTASGVTYGQKLSESTLSGGSNQYGSFTWTNSNMVPTVANSGYEVTFTPSTDTVKNYGAITNTTGTVAITVSKATPAVTVNAVVSDDTGSRKSTLTATVTGAGEGEAPAGTMKFINSTSGSDVDIAGATAVTITDGKATYTWTGLANQIYKIKVVFSGNENYNTATSEELSFDTAKQNQGALTMSSIGTKTYGDSAFNLTTTGGSGNGAVTFTSSDPANVSISGTTATIHKAGTAKITATKAGDSTYNEATCEISLTVAKRDLTVTTEDKTVVKGEPMTAFSYMAEGLVNGDTFTVAPAMITTARDTNTVGEYDIIITGGKLANADNYNISYVNGKLKVVNQLYAISVTYGSADKQTASGGETITITADSRSGYTFTAWSSNDGVTFTDKNAKTTTFTMPGKAVTVTANYSRNSGGDGGSSSNNKGKNSVIVTTPSATTKNPNPPTQVTTTVNSTVSNGKANVTVSKNTIENAISKAQSEAKKKGIEKNGIAVEIKVKVNTKNSSTKNLSVNLPKVTVDALVKAEVKEIRINSGIATINLNLQTLKTIQKEINADVNVSAKKVDNSTLSAEAKAVVGNRPVFDLTITDTNGTKISDFGKGKVSVSIPYTLGANEKVEKVVAYNINENGKVQEMPNSVYDEQNKTLSFVTDHFSKFAVGYKEKTTTAFTDIANHWAKNEIQFVTARGLFSGTGDGKFSPNMSMTRGMFVTVLGRLAEADVSGYIDSSFADVKADAYYMPYIEWANKNSIVNGTSEAAFAPEQSITREQMAVIMANYTKIIGFELPQIYTENTFADNEKISNYAKTAVKQMQMANILAGKNGNKFDPQGTATRAEVSVALKRFVELAL